ncbi:hypothetical protein ACFWNE_33335 [Streptomyces goshikiensis]|uniref:hypothetical protein n=1 Tax=Streptomyces goshikiensis TaxID=1942 RepID=UPI00365C64A9
MMTMTVTSVPAAEELLEHGGGEGNRGDDEGQDRPREPEFLDGVALEPGADDEIDHQSGDDDEPGEHVVPAVSVSASAR